MRVGLMCAVGAVCLATSAAYTHAPAIGASSFAAPRGHRYMASANRGSSVAPLTMTATGAGKEGGADGGGGGGGAEGREDGGKVGKWRNKAASVVAACSVLASATGVQAAQVKPKPVSMALRASRARWFVEDRVQDVSDAVVDAYDGASGVAKKLSKDKSGVVKAGAGVAFVWGSVVGLKRVAKGVEVEELSEQLKKPFHEAESVIGDGWVALSSALAKGAKGKEEGEEGGMSKADKERKKRREMMFAEIEAKVEKGGTSSLTADEFQLMYSELNDMIAHGDSALRKVTDEELEQRRQEREKRRMARKSRFESQGDLEARLRKRIESGEGGGMDEY